MKKKIDNAIPDFFFKKLTDITADDLKAMGVKTIAIDLDNTAVKDSSYRVSPNVRAWARKMKKEGIKPVIVSNTFIHRAMWISYRLGFIPFVAPANKPSVLPLKIAAKLTHTDIHSLAMAGDRLFTDILAANRAGAVSIRVEPIADEILFASRFRRIRQQEKQYLSELNTVDV